MKYILFTLHGYLELFKKKGEKTLFDYARKENFERFVENGIWGFVLLDTTIEKSYFKFLFPEGVFPGESFFRILKYDIQAKGNETFFLGKFASLIDGKIIETEVNLNFNEKKCLLDEIKKKIKNGDIFLFEDEIILKINTDIPMTFRRFPNKIKGKYIREILFKKKLFKKIDDLILNFSSLLITHPINKVRYDLNEPVANFLYLYGMGKYSEKVLLSEKIKKEIFYYSDLDKIDGLCKFFGFNKINNISEFKDNSLYWLNFSLNYKASPSIWVKNFESFASNILKNINFGEDTKFLFIFDPFINPDYEYERKYSIFLASNFHSKIREKYKVSSILFKEFIER